MKQDASWATVSTSYDPLDLYRLIERVVLKQTEDQYPFAAVHEQSLAVLNTKQGGLSNTQWYERFNTRHDVARSVGVDFGHKVLWEYCAQSKHSRSYDALGSAEQMSVKQAAEDRYLAYLLLVNSGAQHDLLRKELQNDFTKGSDKYPENCSQALLFLDRYSKSAPADSGSHGTAFAQKGGRPKRGDEKKGSSGGKHDKKKEYDKKYFKDKPCFKCGKKGHPQSHCPQKDDDDDSSQFTNLLMGAPRLNLTSANEHEPFIERRIRVVKERVRSLRHSLPFQTIPKVILTHMVFYAVKLLNYFPVKGGISEVYGPKAIMSGEVLDFKKFSLPFGSYCQVHEEKLPRNSLASRTLGAISLGPSGNAQGGHRFFTLNTSKVITRRSWDVIPMPKSVVDRANFIGKDQPQQAVFFDRNGNPIGDDDAVHEAPADQTADLPGEMIPEVAPDHPEITGVDVDNYDLVDSTNPVEIPGVDPSADTQHQTIEINDINVSPPAEPSLIEPEQPRRSGRECKPTEKYIPSMSGKSYTYTQLGLSFLQDTTYRYSPDIVAIVMTQLSLKAALK